MERSLSWPFLWQHLTSGSLVAASPLWLVLLPLGAAFTVWAARRAQWPLAALGLRLLSWSSAVAALAQVSLKLSLPAEPLAVVAAVDRSASIERPARQWQERFVEELARHLAPPDLLAVLTFAGRTEVVQWPALERRVAWREAALEVGSTDIAQALRKAAELFPTGYERRLLLLSDGNENRSQALSELPLLRALGIRVFSAAPPVLPAAGPKLRSMTADPVLRAEAPATLNIAIEQTASSGQRVPFQLWFNDRLVDERTLELAPGRTALRFDWRTPAAGAYRWRARIGGSHGVPVEERETVVSVSGPLRVLVVHPRSRSLLARLWQEHGVEVVQQTPSALARQAIDWDGLHALVLEDIASHDIPAGFWKSVQEFAAQGGGVLVIGNQRTFADAALQRTALAEVLPVRIESQPPPRQERAPLSLFLVLDRSNSMGYHVHKRLERSDSESKLAYAKRAALSLIDQLRDTDSVGVIAFDSQMYEVAPLRPLTENRAWLEANIPRIVPGGGTDFYDALEHARRAFVAAKAAAPHIILLTDGDTNRAAAEHEPLIAALAAAKVPVTTIRIGEDTVNLEFLKSISERTGGRFYYVEDASRLPALLLEDTMRTWQQASRQPVRYAARLRSPSQLLRDIDAGALPDLSSYASTRLKPEARSLLEVRTGERTEPLLAVWNYGLGRVAVFTTSFSNGAEGWLTWPNFGTFCERLVRWVARPRAPADLNLAIERRAQALQLRLETGPEWSLADVRGRLTRGEQALDVPFSPEGTHRATAAVPVFEGWAELTVWFRNDNQATGERRFAVYAPGTEDSAGEEPRPANRALLETLATATGGAFEATPAKVAARSGSGRSLIVSLQWLWLPLAMLAFVADAILRRAYFP